MAVLSAWPLQAPLYHGTNDNLPLFSQARRFHTWAILLFFSLSVTELGGHSIHSQGAWKDNLRQTCSVVRCWGGGILFQGPSLSGLKQHVIISQCSYSNSGAEFGPSCPDSPTRYSISAKSLSVFFLRSWNPPSLSLFVSVTVITSEDCHSYHHKRNYLHTSGRSPLSASLGQGGECGQLFSYKGQSLPSVNCVQKGEACAKSLALLSPQNLSTPQHTHTQSLGNPDWFSQLPTEQA